MAYQSALSKGTGEALWGILIGFKELTDLGTQHLNNALVAAWETWRHADEQRYLQTFLKQFEEAEFKELIDVLGIDPRSITRQQWAEAQSLLNFLWHDDETQAQLIDFTKDYIDAQHGLEIAETGAGMVTEVAVDILITALTLGMGAALAVTTKVRHANKLGSLGKVLKQLAQKLKQKAGSKKAQSQTGTWLYEDLEKPAHKTIEPRDGPDGGEYDGDVDKEALHKTNSSRLSQPGGLMATEGNRVARFDGKLSNPTHPLYKHGPDVTDQYIYNRVVNELVAKNRTGLRTAFNDRTQMETAIAETFSLKQKEIDNWLASNPKAGVPQSFQANPGLGNLGRGYEVTAKGGPIVPISKSMPNVNLVLIPDGKSSYLIHTAHPF